MKRQLAHPSVDAWEALTLDVAASRLDREQTTKRLRGLLRSQPGHQITRSLVPLSVNFVSF